MYDLIIKNGFIIDGSGSEGYTSDLAIKDGKIVKIEKKIEESAKSVIDATGLTVTPGFVDSHSHSDSQYLTFPDQKEKIEQGITLSVGGQCGTSPAPIEASKTVTNIGEFGTNHEIYKTMGTFLDTVRDLPLGANAATFVGHSALRKAVIGYGSEDPTPEQMEKMKEYLIDGIKHGAMGISFGLIYSPSCYSKTEELIELAKCAASLGGMVSAHIRSEADALIEAVAEFIEIVEKSGARGVISHHKSSGVKNWGKVKESLKLISEARDRGVDIYCDVYPYIASRTSITASFVPKELRDCDNETLYKRLSDPEVRAKIKKNFLDKGKTDFSYVLVTDYPARPECQGMRLNEIAEKFSKHPVDAALDLIIESKNSTGACYFTMCEEDVETVIEYPFAMICTDSGVAGKKTVFHPRLRASFPRAIGKYTRERGVVTLPEMIRKMTSLPAYVYGFDTKGYIKEGYDADICIFDYERFIDRADYINCTAKCDGLNYVIVGGEVAVIDGVHTGKRCGRLHLRNLK